MSLDVVNLKLIEKQVANFRQECGLGGNEPIRLESLLLKLNVLVVYRTLSDDFSGMSLKDGFEHRFMLINSNQAIGRQQFTIAHELYHLFIEKDPKPHRCSSNGKKNKQEQLADKFASIFLMPSDGVLQMIPLSEMTSTNIQLATVIRLEQYFSVSRSALLNRLTDLELINKVQKEQFTKYPVIESARSYGYDTSLYKPGNTNLIIGDLGEKAKKLFEAGEISEGHYIEVLNKLYYGEEN